MAVFSLDYLVHSYESDAQGRASLPTLCNFMLDSAASDAKELGFGFEDLKARESAWVLSRFLIRVKHYPRWQERVVVKTWPSGTEHLFALRDFLVEDEKGERIAAATSSWIVINAATRSPERIERLTIRGDFSGSDRVLDRNAAKVPPFDGMDFQRGTTAEYADTDLNKHVTSVRYIEWALESLPGEFRGIAEIRELEINFLAESHWGDEIVARSRHDASETETIDSGGNADRKLPQRFLHAILRSCDGTTLCRMRSLWVAASGEV